LAAKHSPGVELIDARDSADLKVLAAGGPGGCAYYNLNHADGSPEAGLWLPLGDYGVQPVALPAQP
jgi:hypothetical protein